MIWEQLSLEHFLEGLDAQEARDLFKKSVFMVEVEVFSYCNRRCWFCPNSKIDRHSTNHFMKPETYSAIMDSLASIAYDRMVTYSRYNEPLSDRIILDRLSEASAKLPRAMLHLNTNGDYLTKAYLEDLYNAGLRSMNIQIYLQNDERYSDERVKQRAEQVLKKLDLPAALDIDKPGEWLQYTLAYKDMALTAYARNFEQNGTDRGGLVDLRLNEVRTSPCLAPTRSIYIDFNGKMMPCCNLRSDAAAHQDCVLGEATEARGIFDIYTNDKATRFRRSVLHFDAKSGVCKHCHFAMEEKTQERIEKMAALQEAAKSMGYKRR